MTTFLCPLCGEPLEPRENGLGWSQGHTFDQGRSGYVHLLPVSGKHA